jgi:prepilin-type N-terminal cleavage/methylation domain-containing protein
MRPTPFRSPRTSAADGGARERGHTLIELVVTLSLLAVVAGTLAAAFVSFQRSEAYTQDRSQTLDEMRFTMNRLTREIRQGQSVVGTPTASVLELRTFVQGQLHTVRYEVSGTTLTRQVDGDAAVALQQRLVSTDLFQYAPTTTAPEVVTLTLRVEPAHAPDTTVTLVSEVRLRNLTEAQ